jgi:hypothetical protein
MAASGSKGKGREGRKNLLTVHSSKFTVYSLPGGVTSAV